MYASDITLFYLYTLKALAFIKLRQQHEGEAQEILALLRDTRPGRPFRRIGDHAIGTSIKRGIGMTVDSEITQQIAAKQAYRASRLRKNCPNDSQIGLFRKISIYKPPQFDDAEFRLVTDPYTQSQDLVGFWYNAGQTAYRSNQI